MSSVAATYGSGDLCGLKEKMEEQERTRVLDADTPSHRKHKRLVLIGLLLHAMCFGVVAVFLPAAMQMSSIGQIIFGFACLLLTLLWCHYDAVDQHFSLSRTMAVSLVLLMVIAFPIYLLRSRGMLPGLKALILACLFFAAMVATASIPSFVAYFIG